MKPIIVIPARMASTRFPGKPLAPIAGRAMILRVADLAKSADLGPVLIAAGDREIHEAARGAGFEAVMTEADLASGTDRINAALHSFDPAEKFDTVINLQGDAPGTDPAPLVACVNALRDNPDADIATLAEECIASEIADNPNIVKAIIAQNGLALYFTRAPAPSGDGPVYHHAGLYAYRRDALREFCNLPQSPLEKRERLEQLRALENGIKITVAVVEEIPPSVDTQEDLAAVERKYFGND
ncbi:MAG: 3-deoxy-manno-octulosonate cytidylyltransferase [Marinicaulis sp.]|nr:3-deoxy-manno-octulosonate cytidylyltransferase [Marinicaulis sp.]